MIHKCTSCNDSLASRYKLTIHKRQQHPNEQITQFALFAKSKMTPDPLTQINIFCTAGSGWVIKTLQLIDIKLCNYRTLRPGSFIPTPRLLQPLRRTTLNIKNFADGLCFIHCVLPGSLVPLT